MFNYLYGARFDVYTDNNPLTYILTTAKLDATGHRWLADLSTFNFSINYVAGRNNVDADSLSRLPQDSVQVICHSQVVDLGLVDILCLQTDVIDRGGRICVCVSHLPLRPPLGSRRGKKKHLLNNPADTLIFIPPNKKNQ